MRRLLPFLAIPALAADLPPDKGNTIPDSAKRPVVVTGKSKLALPKHDLQDGYTLEVAAASPLVTHPIMGCLDDRGRLFVGDATGVNWNKKQLEENPPNRVLMLEDTDKDGAFDKSTIFADKMTFPQGACWLDGSLYVGSPPSIWKLTDTDNDGVADKREEIVTGFEYTGNVADIHGPFLHPNGRLYWCHGRKGHDVKQKDGTPVDASLACGIWSCKPDGSDVAWHSLGCGDNPVEVDFTRSGDIIGVQNLYYTQPRGDTIIHWLYGGVYERSDQLKAIAHLPRTLETMPVMYNFGHVAVSGCCFWRSYGSDAGTPARQEAPEHFLVTHFNTQRLVRMELTPSGSTYKAVENEFLKLHNPDIHLTDVMEDADGSLLLFDTGGWFRIGCPSSLMAKADVLGAVYRVKKMGQKAGDPYGLSIQWEKSNQIPWEKSAGIKHDQHQLLKLLKDKREFVRQKAARLLVRDGKAFSPKQDCNWDLWCMFLGQAIGEGLASDDLQTREAGLLATFIAGQIEHEQLLLPFFGPELERRGFRFSPDYIKALSWFPNPKAARQVSHSKSVPLSIMDLAARRWEQGPTTWSDPVTQSGTGTSFMRQPVDMPQTLASGELIQMAMRRKIPTENKGLLLNTLSSPDIDPATEHAAIYAAVMTKAFGLEDLRNSEHSDTRRRMLAVVRGMAKQQPEMLTPALDIAMTWLLSSPENASAIDFAKTLPEAASKLEPILEKQMKITDSSSQWFEEVSGIISANLGNEAAQRMTSLFLRHSDESFRAVGVKLIATQTGNFTNEQWLPLLDAILAKSPTPILLDAIKKLKSPDFDATLQAIASDTKRPLSIRLKALDSAKSVKLTGATFDMVKNVLADAASSSAAKIQAAGMLAAAPIAKEQMPQIAPLLATVGPVELKTLLPLLKRHKDVEIAKLLAREIAKNPAIASQQESLYRTALADLPPEIFETIILPAYNTAVAATEAKKRQLGPLADKVIASGNAANGEKHFKAGKGTCIACHKIGDTGRAIGPDLSHIGAIRTERDLLESILFPSNTLARDYEAHIIETSDGQQTLGVIKSHTAEGLLVLDIAGQEKNIPHQTITGDTTLTTSLMPMGLDQTMPEGELFDLVAWLRSLK